MIGGNMNEAGPNEELLQKLQAINPNWKMSYKDYLGGTAPQFDSGGQDFLSWEPGIGDSDVMRPVLNMPYKAPDLPDLYDPQALGWSALDANMLREKGVEGLPAYMLKSRIYSPAVSLGGDDPLQTYLNAMQRPDGVDGGKGEKALFDMGWGGMKFAGKGGVEGDLATRSFAPAGAEPQWGGGEQAQYAKDFLRRKWAPDDKGFANPERLMKAASGLAAVGGPMAAVYAMPVEAGVTAAGSLAPEVAASSVPSLSAGQIATEFPAFAGTSLADAGQVATPGFFGSGIGASGGADAALGGMYGTGLGLHGPAMSNMAPSTGMSPEDFLKDKAKGMVRPAAKKVVSEVFAPEQGRLEMQGYGSGAEAPASAQTPQIESGYYNRLTGERLSPEEFFKLHGRASSIR